ncbi:hypothetical protein U14_03121 [Candidatus Moduliflexus flocculans]|uniref:Uncharacterized protein n=1 Tax=Candidatus Moduliflexus flocculans TaxID=1499966 RepID=A0A081BNA9_9BACT|nr:hypothetical protein U14_03121 [Candidatus Moduliflexus flocculans]
MCSKDALLLFESPGGTAYIAPLGRKAYPELT